MAAKDTKQESLDALVPWLDAQDAAGLAQRLATSPFPSQNQRQAAWEHLLKRPPDGQTELIRVLMAHTDWEIRSFVLHEAIRGARLDLEVPFREAGWAPDEGHLHACCAPANPWFQPLLAQASDTTRRNLWLIQMGGGQAQALRHLAVHWHPASASDTFDQIQAIWIETRASMRRNPTQQHALVDQALAALVDLPTLAPWINAFMAHGLQAEPGLTWPLTQDRLRALARQADLQRRPAGGLTHHRRRS